MMPTDPVQVVTEAPCVLPKPRYYDANWPCNRLAGMSHPECAVAALRAAGALAEGEVVGYQVLSPEQQTPRWWMTRETALGIDLTTFNRPGFRVAALHLFPDTEETNGG